MIFYTGICKELPEETCERFENSCLWEAENWKEGAGDCSLSV